MNHQSRKILSPGEDEEPLLEERLGNPDGSMQGENTMNNIKDQDGVKGQQPSRTIVIEPMLLLYVIAGFPSMALQSQYQYLKVARTMGINITLNDNNSTCGTNLNDSHYLDRERVQAEAAQWNMYMSMTEFVITFTLGFVYGTLSDKFGRKPLLALPCIGSIAGAVVNMAIVYFDLPLYCFLFTNVEYLFGGFTTLFTGSFAYMADTVPKEKLGLRITILDAVMLSAGGLSSLGVGYWIKKVGYFWPYLFVIGGKSLALLYVKFFIPETVVDNSKHKTTDSALQHLIKGIKLVTADNGTGRRCKINIIFLSYFVGELFMGYTIFSLFEMNAPLCWNSVMMGYYEAVSLFVRCVTMVAGAAILRKCLPEEGQAIISKLSAIAEYVFLIFVTNTIMMFFVPLFGGFVFLFLPMYRAILSKLVGLDEQGVMFAVFSCLSRVNQLVGSLLTNKVYAATLLFMEGFVFLVAAIAVAFSLAIFMIYVVIVRRERRANKLLSAEKQIQGTEPNEVTA